MVGEMWGHRLWMPQLSGKMCGDFAFGKASGDWEQVVGGVC